MKPLMLVSQPNSGSTWFSNCIAKAAPDLVMYPKEFFNPILNWKYQLPLARVLGCELPHCVHNIAAEHCRAEVELAIRDTWDKESFTFTKENYLAFQLHHFADRFEMIGLIRDLRSSFPPSRIRAMAWYESIFHSLLSNHRLSPVASHWISQRRHNLTSETRALIAWQCYRWQLGAQFSKLRITVFDYDDLIRSNFEQLRRLFRNTPDYINADALAGVVRFTREEARRDEKHSAQWAQAFDSHAAFLAECGAEQVAFYVSCLSDDPATMSAA